MRFLKAPVLSRGTTNKQQQPIMLVNPKMHEAICKATRGFSFSLPTAQQAQWDANLVTLVDGSQVSKTALEVVLAHAKPKGETPS